MEAQEDEEGVSTDPKPSGQPSAFGCSVPPAKKSGHGAWHLVDASYIAVAFPSVDVAFTLFPQRGQILGAERPNSKHNSLAIQMGKSCLRWGKALA